MHIFIAIKRHKFNGAKNYSAENVPSETFARNF